MIWFKIIGDTLDQILMQNSIEVVKLSESELARRLAGANVSDIIDALREIQMPKEVFDAITKELVSLSRLFGLETWQVMNALGLNAQTLAGRYSDVAINWNFIDNKIVNRALTRTGEMISGDISKTTINRIAEKVAEALQQGKSIGELKDSIMEAGILSEARAEMIARTETAMAVIDGRQETMLELMPNGFKEWSLAPDACEECEAYGGVSVPIDEDFPEGDPPLHPNCRCDLLYWTSEEIDQREEEPETPFVDLGI